MKTKDKTKKYRKEPVKDKKAKKLKCWEVFNCEQKECPAYKSKDLNCWLFSGTLCRDAIQGKFLDKVEMCLDCEPFKANMDANSIEQTLKAVNKQFKEFKTIIGDRDREMEKISMDLAIGLSEVFEALKKISSGDPTIRISETSEVELITKLKHMVNLTAENIGEIVDQSHEFAIVLAEHFDVLHRVSTGDLNARVYGSSNVELLESLKRLTNDMIGTVYREISDRKLAEDLLRKSKENYIDLYENAPDGYHSLGPDGTILEVNNTWLSMLGYERDEVIGRMKLQDFLIDKGLKTFQNTLPELKEKGSIENINYNFKRKDGTFLPVLLNSIAIYDEKGEFLKTRSTVRDNSVKRNYEKLLEKTSREWRSTFDSMPYGVMLLDREFKIIKANQYISTLSGIPIKDLIGKKSYESVYKSNNPIGSFSQIGPSRPLTTETIEFYEPKSNKYFMVYSTPILDEKGLIKTFVHSLVDITESKEKEKAIVTSRDAFLNMLKDLDNSYKDLKEMYNGLIFSFSYALDAKSPWTKGHSERVTKYSLTIAKELGLKENDLETLNIAALLHDIGKIGTYDTILDKPARLTDEEFALVKMHPAKGADILKPIRQLQHIIPIIRHHHERIDGRGYPDGLKDKEIPFFARIIHVADSYDSMTADRPYRPAPGKEYAISELKKYSGTQFDPDVVEAFLKVIDNSKGKHAAT